MKHAFSILITILGLFTATSGSAQTFRIIDNTLNAGKVDWLPRQIQMGAIPYDLAATGTFVVKNISNEPLIITNVKSGCHCTVVDWDKNPIPPGGETKIVAVYDAKKEGEFYKIVTVLTNFDPQQSVTLSLTGTVLPK